MDAILWSGLGALAGIALTANVVILITLQRKQRQILETMQAPRTMEQWTQSSLSRIEQNQTSMDQGVLSRFDRILQNVADLRSGTQQIAEIRRLFSGVKTRGIFGETQLRSLLEDMFTADQFMADFTARPGTQERVEFALRLHSTADGQSTESELWLPIDSKFPIEDFSRLLEARDGPEPAGASAQTLLMLQKQISQKMKQFADDINKKYIAPPRTTEFAILFVPTEALFLEVNQIPGLTNEIYRKSRVLIAGPTNLSALLQIVRQTSQWSKMERKFADAIHQLSDVTLELHKLEESLTNSQNRLQQSQQSIDENFRRIRVLKRKILQLEENSTSMGDAKQSPTALRT